MSSTSIKTMLLTVAATSVMLLQACAPSGDGKVFAQGDGAARRVAVSVTTVAERSFEERIIAQGTLLAKNYAMVSPQIDGVVTDMFVEEGDRVKANETPLFQIEKIMVTQAYEIAAQERKVAEYARREAEAQVAAVQSQYDKAKLDYERFTRLREQQAITLDAMEQMEAGFALAKAQLERVNTGVALRAEQEKQAEAALVMSKKRLDDSLQTSPIDGWISYRGKKQGEFAGVGTPIVKVTDTSLLEISVFLPGEYYPRIQVQETQLHVMVSGIDLGLLPVVYKSPEIQEQLRTFEVKCLVESPPDGVVPGAIANVEAVLHSSVGPGVPSDVIQIRDGRDVVFVVEGDAAKAVEIQKGLIADGWTEVLDNAVAPGTVVITLGSNMVNDGTPVDVQQQEEK